MPENKLPRDPEAEKMVVGSLILAPDKYEGVAADIPGQAFQDPAMRALYDACGECVRVHGTFDSQLLMSQLRDSPEFGSNQPATVALEICKEVSTSAHLGHFAERLMDNHRKVQLHDACVAGLKSIAAGKSSTEIVSDMGADLDGISRSRRDQGLVRCSDVEPKEMNWLWPGWLAAGEFHLFDGDPEVGKSQVTCDIAARVSTGKEFPLQDEAYFRQPENVLLIAAEDSLAHTIVPRLAAADADMERVFCWPEDRELPTLPSRIDILRHEVDRNDIKLVVIDPLIAYLDAHINAHRDADVRRALQPLIELARDLGAAVIGIRHLNKDESKSALYRGGGSIGFVAIARVGWIIAYEDSRKDRRVLAGLKGNLTAKPQSCVLTIQKRPKDLVSHVQWEEVIDRSAYDLLEKNESRPKKVDQCAAKLEVLLAGGPKPATKIQDALIAEGFSTGTIKNARSKLSVEAEKNGFQGAWTWVLPSTGDKQCEMF